MSSFVSPAAQLLGRLLMAAIFVLGGLGKIGNPAGTMGYIAAGGLPFPELSYYASIVIELGGGLAILFGVLTRPVALLMAIFCVVTGVIFHYHPGDVPQMTNYMKNLAMAGGFLQLFACGGGRFSVDTLLFRR